VDEFLGVWGSAERGKKEAVRHQAVGESKRGRGGSVSSEKNFKKTKGKKKGRKNRTSAKKKVGSSRGKGKYTQ